jgi:hypothetical protein
MANSTGLRTISFNVNEQYDIQDVVGEGAYGIVWYVYALFRAAYWLTSMPLQLRARQAIWPKGRHQEDYSF